MKRKIKALAVVSGMIAAGVALLELTIKAGCYFLLFLFTI